MNRILIARCAIVKNEKMLVLFRIKHHEYVFPGGKIDSTEDKKAAVVRETKEEIGCDIDLIKSFGFEDFTISGKNFRQYLFLAKLKKNQKPKLLEPELYKEINWIPIKNCEGYPIAPHIKKFCDKYLIVMKE